jgi:archaellum component FlaC
MGTVEADIAVIKNDISHIKEVLDEIKKTTTRQDERCDGLSERVGAVEGEIRTHNKYFATVAAALLALGGWITTWFTSGGRGL